MGVRLNKVLTELNIGLQTAVDFLKAKTSLGEIKDDANVNTKITDEQYDALVKEFKGDKDVKAQAGMIFPKKKDKPKKEQKPEPVVEEVREEPRQTFTPLGKIDLSQVGKSAKPKEEPKPQPKPEPVVTPKAEPVQVVNEEKPEVKPEPKEDPKPKEEPKMEPKPEVKPEPEPEPKSVVVEPAEKETQAQSVQEEPNVFKLKTEQKAMPNLNVVGKIDLDALNQSTRPKKKSKEERRKEREEKQAQQHGGANGEKKKRERIRGGKERVDIEAAANQDKGQNQNKKNKNKGGNQNFQDNGGNQQGGG